MVIVVDGELCYRCFVGGGGDDPVGGPVPVMVVVRRLLKR